MKMDRSCPATTKINVGKKSVAIGQHVIFIIFIIIIIIVIIIIIIIIITIIHFILIWLYSSSNVYKYICLIYAK